MLNFATAPVSEILKRAGAGKRISAAEGLELLRGADIFELADTASKLCHARVRGSAHCATYVIDRNINYTNYCAAGCSFCGFYRRHDDGGGYVLTKEEIAAKIEPLVALGGSQVMLQGGLNPDLTITYYEDVFRYVKTRFPNIIIHALSAPEVCFVAQTSALGIRETLKRLQAAGLESLPGGGAEILDDDVRKRISPSKISTAEYLEVHRVAHEAGIKSTATMVFGFGEPDEARVSHLIALRALQDQTGGFRAFIPWSFQAEGTAMRGETETGESYLRIVALARIVLDNFTHIQAGWLTEGGNIAQMALRFGADDFGGILMEEKVVAGKEAMVRDMAPDEICRLITAAGKKPVCRNTRYEFVDTGRRTQPSSDG